MLADHPYGWLSLIPPLVVVLLALWTRLSLEPLLVGIVTGYVLIDIHTGRFNFFDAVLQSFQSVLQNELMVWIILVCSLYGALINLMIRSGGINAFGALLLRYTTSPKKALLSTWLFGTLLFVDDYLNALTTGTTMKKITDHFRLPRELLAYVVSSTAVPICVIVPVSTWVIFIGKLLEDAKLVAPGAGLASYAHIIPFISYGYIQFLLVPLSIIGVLPFLGPMRRAIARAENSGQLIPPNSEGFKVEVSSFHSPKPPSPLYLVLPLVVLFSATILLHFDALKGVVAALFFSIAYYRWQRVASLKDLSDCCVEGIKSMTYALVLLVLSYVLKELGDAMKLTDYVIATVQGLVSREFLPLAVFLTLGAIAFATGNSWGLYAIAIPLVAPLALNLHANLWLCIGALISAGAFGAHACFFSDATILAAQGSECNNYAHGITQLPYALISFAISCVLYGVMGFIF